jgi:hypothetical protein
MNQDGSVLCRFSRYTFGGLVLALATLISGCAGLNLPGTHLPPAQVKTPVPLPASPAPPVQVETVEAAKPIELAPEVPAPAKEPEPLVALLSPSPATVQGLQVPGSQAHSARDYRKDAAGHLYKKYADRIYKGTLPAMLRAVAVVEVDINQQGAVTGFRWMRAPLHVPTIMTEIEGMVYASSPFPVPHRMGTVTYIEAWLWDKSGRFQLDTLTQGQK